MSSFDTPLPGPSELQLGQILRELRRIKCLELEQLARISGIEVDDIDALEQGRHGADVATLRRLARGLGMSVGTIFALWERQSLASALD